MDTQPDAPNIPMNLADVLAEEGAANARLRASLHVRIAQQAAEIADLRRRLGLMQAAVERLQAQNGKPVEAEDG